ncbi:SIS domain-containing protein [bacterium]|jgi:D-sedoheptulose 7-phosphate isomerase|nr:SIS domain-containing protein [bacterium]
MNNIEKLFQDSIDIKIDILKSNALDCLIKMSKMSVKAIKDNKKIILCGNGGSAADAQHLAAEMLVRLRPMNNREGIPAIALAQDTSTITACGNDFGYSVLYQRLVKTLGNKGDCMIAITTSGNSENIILAMKEAKEMGIKVFGFLGSGGGKALEYCDEAFLVPSDNTGRIQESHITAGHALMECIEDGLIESGFIHLKD